MKRCPKCDSANIKEKAGAVVPFAVCADCDENFTITKEELKELQIAAGHYYPQLVDRNSDLKIGMNIPKVRVDINDAPMIVALKEKGVIANDDVCIICTDSRESDGKLGGGVLLSTMRFSVRSAAMSLTRPEMWYFLLVANKNELKLCKMHVEPELLAVNILNFKTIPNGNGAFVSAIATRGFTGSEVFTGAQINIKVNGDLRKFFANVLFGNFKQRANLEKVVETINKNYPKK